MTTPDAASPSGPVGAAARNAADDALAALRRRADSWAELADEQRASLLDRSLNDLTRVADRWVAAGVEVRGVADSPAGVAEEWLFFAAVLRATRLLRGTLHRLATQHRLPPPGPGRRLPDGRLAVRAFPMSWLDRLAYAGMSGYVVIDPELAGPDPSAPPPAPPAGEVAVVLGAGNAAMLPVIDMLHQLFVERRVVALKPNPVNSYLGPLIEEGFAALIEAGCLRVVSGDGAMGAYLATHPGVDAVHLTGSRATFDAIVTARTGANNANDHPYPIVSSVTAELGNVSPVIVVPGRWSAGDLRRQAARIATWLVGNAGFGCLTPRMLITHREWPQRADFLAALRHALESTPTRPAYYPGAAGRFEAFTGAHPRAWRLGPDDRGRLPWVLVPDVDPTDVDDICFRREAFVGLLAETSLSAAGPADFVANASAFADTTLWGTLVATVVAHPRSLADRTVRAAVDRAILSLRYGTVTVNAPAFAAYYLQTLPWGAFSDEPGRDTDSGIGRTANSYLLRGATRSVLWGRFRPWPDPISVSAARPDRFARRLAAFEAAPSLVRLPAVLAAALRAGRRPTHPEEEP